MTLKSQHFPIFILLIISLLVGVFTFQDYGMTWDEGLYYGYGEAIGYAYSIPARFSGEFDINLAYGPSVGDHRNRGPAYLLASRLPVLALNAITGIKKAELWHLMNFITFLVGILYFYKLALRWLQPQSAFAASLFYLSQPMLWGHGFINPKDPPFATLFVITLYYGFQMVDQLATTEASQNRRETWKLVILTGILIGLATNLRVIAPILAVLLLLYALTKRKLKLLLWFIPVGVSALIALYLTWPYLWEAPVARFMEVLALMSNNPTKLKVLFYGNTYRAYELPLRYLPVLLGITLTEPTWLLFTFGLGVVGARFWRDKNRDWQSLGIMLFYLMFMVGYVLTVRPPMYDGFRHFLFILPPIFVVAGFAFEQFFAWTHNNWLHASTMLLIAALGLLGILKLHPYEYAYYNSFVGGTSGAEGSFETDYWLTCYKEALAAFEALPPKEKTLIVYREAKNAAYYANEKTEVISLATHSLKAGDYLLLSARLDEVHTAKKHSPNIIEIGRDGATFCAIREIAP